MLTTDHARDRETRVDALHHCWLPLIPVSDLCKLQLTVLLRLGWRPYRAGRHRDAAGGLRIRAGHEAGLLPQPGFLIHSDNLADLHSVGDAHLGQERD